MQQIISRIEELEAKTAFQEMTIDELNNELISLNRLLTEQQFQIQLLITKLKAVEPSNLASPNEETPPPHY